MKDLRVTYETKSFVDLVPVVNENGCIVFSAVSDERKLVQSIVKLLLTPIDLHFLDYGSDHANFDENEILRVLKLYNDTTETDNPAELVDVANVRRLSLNEYEIVITTQKGTEVRLKAGV